MKLSIKIKIIWKTSYSFETVWKIWNSLEKFGQHLVWNRLKKTWNNLEKSGKF